MRESASRGFLVHSGTPFGYRRIKVKDGKAERATLEVDPHSAPIVKRIFHLALRGNGLKEIAKALNADGIASPKGKRWGTTTLHKVLVNETYTGTLVWGVSSARGKGLPALRVEDAWPAIVDRENYEQVKAQLRARSPKITNPRRVASSYLLSGLARCGSCGKALIGLQAKSGKFDYYVCGTLVKQGAGSCNARYLNALKFEALVIDEIRNLILTPTNLQELVLLVDEEMIEATRDQQQRLADIDRELSDVAGRLAHLYDVLETGALNLEDLGPRIQHLRHREDQLQATKEKLSQVVGRPCASADLAVVTSCAEDLREVLSQGTLVERKSFIKSFVQEVLVNGEEATVRYTFPLPLDDLESQSPKVLDSIHYGGAGGARTLYLFNAIEALSQLSYSPTNSQTFGPTTNITTGPKARNRYPFLTNFTTRRERPQLPGITTYRSLWESAQMP